MPIRWRHVRVVTQVIAATAVIFASWLSWQILSVGFDHVFTDVPNAVMTRAAFSASGVMAIVLVVLRWGIPTIWGLAQGGTSPSHLTVGDRCLFEGQACVLVSMSIDQLSGEIRTADRAIIKVALRELGPAQPAAVAQPMTQADLPDQADAASNQPSA